MLSTQQINKNHVVINNDVIKPYHRNDVIASHVVNGMNGIRIAGDTNTNGHHHSPNVSADTNGYNHHQVSGALNGIKAIPDPLLSPHPVSSLSQNQTSGSLVHQWVEDATNFLLQQRTGDRPTIGIICGSGLGGLADLLQEADVIPYSSIPYFPISSVAGHAGKLVFGKLEGKNVVCMQGRVHLYEGVEPWKLTLPVRVMAGLGIKVLIATNAAGALNDTYEVGDIMIIKDHINLPSFAGNSPLVGVHDTRFGARFVSLTDAYDRDLRRLARTAACSLNIDFLREGVYTVQAGPLYETVAECRMLRMLGSDAVGMSTAPEVSVARQCGVRCLGLSLITNVCVCEYDTGREPNHTEVMEIGQRRATDMQNLVAKIVSLMSN